MRYSLLRSMAVGLYTIVLVWLAWLVGIGRLVPIDGAQLFMVALLGSASVASIIRLVLRRVPTKTLTIGTYALNALILVIVALIVALNPVADDALSRVWWLIVISAPVVSIVAMLCDALIPFPEHSVA